MRKEEMPVVKVTVDLEDGSKQELDGDTAIIFTVSKVIDCYTGNADKVEGSRGFLGREIPNLMFPKLFLILSGKLLKDTMARQSQLLM